MKNILKTIIFAFCLVALASCEDDPDPIVSANGFTLRTIDGSSSSVVLVPDNEAEVITVLNWDKSDNGVGNTSSQYIVEVAAAGSNFAAPVTANNNNFVASADRTYAFTINELNNLVNRLPNFECGKTTAVDIRIKSVLGSGFYNQFVQYSSVVTLNVTPYTSELPTMAFSADANITDATPKLASSASAKKDYEGYMWLEPGTYKFYKADYCNEYGAPTVYGTGHVITTADYYFVTANLSNPSAFTYEVRAIKWNLFGAAKMTFPQANTPMTYDPVSKLWKLRITLGSGYEFKFRSTGTGTVLVLGKANVTTGSPNHAGPIMSYSGDDFNAPGAKSTPRVNISYDVALDLSKPRDYKYTLTVAAP